MAEKSKLFVIVSNDSRINLDQILDHFKDSMNDYELGKATRELLDLSVGNAAFVGNMLFRRID